jgi:hypothetical protein
MNTPASAAPCSELTRGKPWLTEIIHNLSERIAAAKMSGWLGEVEGLQISLRAAQVKLTSLNAQRERICGTITDLGLPVLRDSPQLHHCHQQFRLVVGRSVLLSRALRNIARPVLGVPAVILTGHRKRLVLSSGRT